jgi:predicted nucleic acid-binding protein
MAGDPGRPEQPVEAPLRSQLGAGEAGAILLALEVAPARIVLDYRRARRAAEQLGIAMIGTPGLLVLAKRRALLDQVRPVLSAMRNAGFYVSKELIEKTLRAAGESGGT